MIRHSKKSLFGWDITLTIILGLALLAVGALIIWAIKGDLLLYLNKFFN